MNLSNEQLTILASFLIGLPLFVYTLVSVDMSRVREISATIKLFHVLAYVLASVASLLIYTHIWKLFLRSYDVNLSLSDLQLFNFRMAGFAISYVTPGPRIGGEVTRGGLLSSHSNISQKTGSMAGVMEKFVVFVASVIFDTILVIAALLLLPNSFILKAALGTLIGLAVLMLIGWYGFVQKEGARKFVAWITEWVEMPTDMLTDTSAREPESYAKNHAKTVMRGVTWALLGKMFIGLQMYILLAGLSLPITLLQALILAAATDIAYSIPSYMGLGALEAGQSGILSLIGGAGAASAGVVVAFITRLRDITFSGYGLAALTYYSSNGAPNSEG